MAELRYGIRSYNEMALLPHWYVTWRVGWYVLQYYHYLFGTYAALDPVAQVSMSF
jgi:hypothetical protein